MRTPFLPASLLILVGLGAVPRPLAGAVIEVRQEPRSPVISDLRVSADRVGEGDAVTFHASVAPGDPAGIRFTWDFGDGSDPLSGLGMSSVRHRYGQRGPAASTYRVTLEVVDNRGAMARRSIDVEVANVAPALLAMERDGPALERAPLAFRAGAVDPGPDDELTFVWSFGDGGGARGRRVEHRYAAPGRYRVDLTVDDGDGGVVTGSLDVTIGEGGVLSVSGDVSLPRQDLSSSLLGGSVAPNGMCQVTLAVETGQGTSLTLQAMLPRGLRRGTYPVIRDDGTTQPWVLESSRPGNFTAALGIDPAFHPWDRGLFSLASVAGSVTVEHFDGSRLELSFDLTALERASPSAVPPPATARVQGWVARAVGNSFMRAGSLPGAFYLCDVDAGAPLRIANAWPEADAVNVDLDEPGIEVEFAVPVDGATIHDETFRVEYRLPDVGASGATFQRVAGVLEHAGGRRYRFVPVAPLRDGLIYRVTVAGGADGVRGGAGEMLDADHSWRFSTLVEPEAIRVAAFQVSRNAPLVPGKTTLARVYVDWREKDDVHPDWQVVRFPARVEVRIEGGNVPAYTPVDTILTRPDLFSTTDSAQARNSVNFFGWQPSGARSSSTLAAVVEPLEQRVAQPRRYESGPLQLAHHPSSPVLRYDARYVLVRSWSGGIPPDIRAAAERVLREGSRFTVQNFPIVGMEGVAQPLPLSEPTDPVYLDTVQGKEVYRYDDSLLGQDSFVDDRLARMAHDLVSPGPEVDLLILFLPKEVQPTVAGFRYDFPTKTLAIFLPDPLDDDAVDVFTSTMAHETGHAFGLEHATVCDLSMVECAAYGKAASDPVEGFRLRADGSGGWNKSQVEGNEEAPNTLMVISLMHPSALGSKVMFITLDDYLRLLEHPRFTGQGGG